MVFSFGSVLAIFSWIINALSLDCTRTNGLASFTQVLFVPQETSFLVFFFFFFFAALWKFILSPLVNPLKFSFPELSFTCQQYQYIYMFKKITWQNFQISYNLFFRINYKTNIKLMILFETIMFFFPLFNFVIQKVENLLQNYIFSIIIIKDAWKYSVDK